MKSNGNGNGHSHANGYGFEVPPDFDDDDEPEVPPPQPKTWKFDYVPTGNWWLERKLPPRDFLMEGWLSTTSRILLCGPSGVGKTNFNLGLVLSAIAGLDFLHWRAVRPARVVFVDGEMPRELTQEWLGDAVRRRGLSGEVLDNVIILSREDFPDMPPLNTPEGQEFFDQFLQHIGPPVDLISFDNIQALLEGDMKDTLQWAGVKKYQLDLTGRGIGQIWNHHTNDQGRSYGDKSREWQMESVILLEKVEHSAADIAFNLKFEKARIRKPQTRHHFDDVLITLDGDDWLWERGKQSASQKPLPDKAATRLLVLGAIDEALEKDPQHLFGNPKVAPDIRCAKVDLCLKYFANCYPGDSEKTARNRFFEAVRTLPQIAYVKDADIPYVHRV